MASSILLTARSGAIVLIFSSDTVGFITSTIIVLDLVLLLLCSRTIMRGSFHSEPIRRTKTPTESPFTSNCTITTGSSIRMLVIVFLSITEIIMTTIDLDRRTRLGKRMLRSLALHHITLSLVKKAWLSSLMRLMESRPILVSNRSTGNIRICLVYSVW